MVIKSTRSYILLAMAIIVACTESSPAQQPEDSAAQDNSLPVEDSTPDNLGNSPTVRMTAEGNFEITMKDAPLNVVLEQLLLKSRRNIIFSPGVRDTRVTVTLFDVTLDQALEAILRPHNMVFVEENNAIYVYTRGEYQEFIDSQRVMTTKTIDLNYISPTDARDLLTPFLSTDGSIIISDSSTSSSSTSGALSGGQSLAIENIMIVQDYEENVQAVEDNLARIDQRPKQVLVEATILRATLNESNAMGVDFNILGGVDFELLAAEAGITFQNGPNVSIGTGTTGTDSGDATSTGGNSDFGRVTNTIPFSKLDDVTFGSSTSFSSSVPAGGLSFGVVTDHVSMFIRALEAVTDVAVLANPKVLTLNRQYGHVLVGSRDGYLTTTVTNDTSIQNVSFLETGTQLEFRPFVSNDGYVRMEISPRDSTGGISSLGLPFERTTEVTTNINVKDGYTILIGGLFRDVTTAGRSQIPFLGSIPVVGSAFGSTSDSTVREEVIILLTVHIVTNEDAYAAESENILDDLERTRIGIRESMQVFGRERLAQFHFHKAMDHVVNGKQDLALWHAKLAVHNRPTFLEALKLREDILGTRAWDDDGSIARQFLHSLVLQSKGEPVRFFDRPLRPQQTIQSPAPSQSLPMEQEQCIEQEEQE